MKLTVNHIEIIFNKKTHKISHMSDWSKCWDLYRAGYIDSNYITHLHGDVDFFVHANDVKDAEN